MPLKRREMIEILRVKSLYETKVRDLTGWGRTFSISESEKVGARNLRYLQRINSKCKARGIDVRDFLSVIFHQLKWPYVTVDGRKLAYPYLSFLQSDKTFDIYRRKRRALRTLFGNPEVAKDVIKAHHPSVYDTRFANCFYEGFTILWNYNEEVGWRFINDPLRLFEIFLAWRQTFTPEFLATHSKFEAVLDLKDEEISESDRELKIFLVEYTKRIFKRMNVSFTYRRALKRARKSVMERELRMVEQLNKQKRNWRRVWDLLS